MKVCLTSWAPFVAGAEIAVERLAVGLAEAGHDVLLVVGTDGEALTRFRDAGIRCEFIAQQFTDKRKWLRYRRSRKALTELLRREQPDLVHSNDLPTHQMTSDAARRLPFQLPRVCHHRWIFERAAIDWLNKFGAERHLFVSDALMRMLCEASPKLESSPRSVVYDGLPIPEMPSDADRLLAKRELGIDRERVTVLFAGQIIERKGVADLLHAWDLLSAETRSRGELVIVGDTGIVVATGDVDALTSGMYRLVSDVNLRLALGNVARRRVECEFNPKVSLMRVREIYHSITR